ncbi:uclacyanin-3-like [Malania oleifera]|uniref:uclacyanin-3-like n=1 Tax=Malania oleifera TaxID=397392 RepID=UPI0025AE5DDD|nr:uclacyanin-3-like [Malania oleifera]
MEALKVCFPSSLAMFSFLRFEALAIAPGPSIPPSPLSPAATQEVPSLSAQYSPKAPHPPPPPQVTPSASPVIMINVKSSGESEAEAPAEEIPPPAPAVVGEAQYPTRSTE